MQFIPRCHHVHTFCAAELSPTARARSGQSVCFDTLDALEGFGEQAATGDYRPATDAVNPATGPLYVEGAKPGDALMVEVLDIRCDEAGYIALWMPHIGVAEPERDFIRIPLIDGKADIDGVAFELSPIIGTIGLAHPDGLDCRCAGEWGGNMDTKEVRKGAALFLPVFVEGALLSMGDLHALQGDGEMFGQGIETGGQVDVRVTVIRDAGLERPLLLTADKRVQAIAADDSLERAAEIALGDLGRHMVRWGVPPKRAAALLAAKADFFVGQIVNPQATARVSLPLEDLRRIGADISLFAGVRV